MSFLCGTCKTHDKDTESRKVAPRDWGTGGDRKDVLPKDTKFELGKRNNFKNSIIQHGGLCIVYRKFAKVVGFVYSHHKRISSYVR